jgi:hypothetical protein
MSLQHLAALQSKEVIEKDDGALSKGFNGQLERVPFHQICHKL